MSHHHKNKHFGPFQDHPHTPKGVTFEKAKRPVLQVKISFRGKNMPKYLATTKSRLYKIDLKLKTPAVDTPIDLTW